jgi:hypothetical protein
MPFKFGISTDISGKVFLFYPVWRQVRIPPL